MLWKPHGILDEVIVNEIVAFIDVADLRRQPKGHPVTVRIARRLRKQTPMNRQSIADRLTMGSPGYVSNLLVSVDSKLSSLC